MSEEESTTSRNPAIRLRQIIGWIALGGLLAAILIAVFLAYGQPELLLREMNLRYCG